MQTSSGPMPFKSEETSIGEVTEIGLRGAQASPERRKSVHPHIAVEAGIGLIVPLIGLAGWEVGTRFGWLDGTLISSPAAILSEICRLLITGAIWEHLGATFVRVLGGFALGCSVAFALGVLTGTVPLAYRLINPTVNAIRSVPSYAWVPLFILWFGIFETSKILLIGLGAFFPLYLAVATSVRSVDRKLVEVALVNGFKGPNLLRHILVPASLPAIFVGLRQSLGLAWMFVVAAEFMGATSGLGFLLIDGQTTGRPSTLITSILLFALCGKATDGILAWVGQRSLHWLDVYSLSR
jgi:sulfonate transport system permease protein